MSSVADTAREWLDPEIGYEYHHDYDRAQANGLIRELLEQLEASEKSDYSRVTRITVVTDTNRVFEQYGAFKGGVELHLQDDGRTLKVFPLTKEQER